MDKINVLSLFDGMSCGQIALQRVGIPVNAYYASEIDKHAITVTMANYPDTVQLGSVTGVSDVILPPIDLLIGGSPCQSFSFAGKMVGMATTCNQEILTLDQYLDLKKQGFAFQGQSYLFWEYVRILKELKPRYFLLENVSMLRKWQDLISKTLGVEPIKINSALVSAQNRKRLYWTNIPGVQPPKDRGVLLFDILQESAPDKYIIAGKWADFLEKNRGGIRFKKKFIQVNGDKAMTMTARMYANWVGNFIRISKNGVPKMGVDKAACITGGAHSGGNHSDMDLLVYNDGSIRRYTPTECERLQTVPDGYTAHVSDTQRYKMLGNGWTVDVVAHILSYMAADNL